MNKTKTQLFEEIRSAGLDEQTVMALQEDFANLPEELTAQDMDRIDAVLAELEATQKYVASEYGEMADQYEKAADEVLNAGDDFVEQAAQTTYNHVKTANDILGE